MLIKDAIKKKKLLLDGWKEVKNMILQTSFTDIWTNKKLNSKKTEKQILQDNKPN